jgi:hypothetical protein
MCFDAAPEAGRRIGLSVRGSGPPADQSQVSLDASTLNRQTTFGTDGRARPRLESGTSIPSLQHPSGVDLEACPLHRVRLRSFRSEVPSPFARPWQRMTLTGDCTRSAGAQLALASHGHALFLLFLLFHVRGFKVSTNVRARRTINTAMNDDRARALQPRRSESGSTCPRH